jgi:DNA-binding response OmpR family regulator
MAALRSSVNWRTAYRRDDIDLVLTDLNMPGSMDGIALAKHVHERWSDIRIAVISGQTVPLDFPARALFFRKPMQAEEVVAELRALLRHPR